VWWFITVISAFGKQRREYREFEVNLGYAARKPSPKKPEIQTNNSKKDTEFNLRWLKTRKETEKTVPVSYSLYFLHEVVDKFSAPREGSNEET
jgi:hypothetical protein